MKTQAVPAVALVLGLASVLFSGEEQDTRVFEMRTYYAAPGRLNDLEARFRDHTLKLFEKHGLTNIGYWTPIDNSENKLIYVLAFPSAVVSAPARASLSAASASTICSRRMARELSTEARKKRLSSASDAPVPT